MVDALILGREGIIVPEATCYAPALPGIEDVLQMDRWEPFVRAYTALGEMLQGISFQTAGNGLRVLSSMSQTPSTSLIAEVQRPLAVTFVSQMPMVLSWAELRYERASEILAQIDPQYAFWSSVVYMHPDRTKRTFELVNIVLQFCVYMEMRFKHALACWRPVEYNAEVQPMITTPGHGTFPMGHGTNAYAVAYVLRRLLDLDADPRYGTVIEQLDRQAARITTNRVVAGVHFPVDSMAGRMLGVALGEYFVGRCTGTAVTQNFLGRTFNAGQVDAHATTDFNPFSPDQELGPTPAAGMFYSCATGLPAVRQSDLMAYMWEKAQREWAGRFGVPPA